MNVRELIDLLEDMPEDAEVRLAIQPNYPFQHDIGDVVSVDVTAPSECPACGADVEWDAGELFVDHDPECELGRDALPEHEPQVVAYIAERGQHYAAPYLPGTVANVLGWGR